MQLCCTSVMLPRWELDETFDRLQEYGYDAIELRCRYNPDDPDVIPSYWGRHLSDVSPDNILDKAEQIRAAVQRTGIRVAALAPNPLYHETEVIVKLFKGALAIDPDRPPVVRVGAPMHDRSKPYWPQFLEARAGFANLTELARAHGVKAVYEIHTGTIAVSASRTLELLRDLDPDHMGAIYDVQNMVEVGIEDTRMGLELLGPYVAHCHVGNRLPVATGRTNAGNIGWRWRGAKLALGVADIPRLIGDLKTVGYEGALSLEQFMTGDDAEIVKTEGAFLRELMERDESAESEKSDG